MPAFAGMSGYEEIAMTDATRLIDLQIMWNRLIAVVEEQAQVLMRTAFSPIVRECGDLSAGVFDRQGRMLAQAVTGTPGHVNSMAESVKHFIRHFPLDTMKPGDAYITNDPVDGHRAPERLRHHDAGVQPKGELVALFSCTSHLMDIGGIGFGPDATDVFMEGLYIPMLKLIDQGTVNETLMAMIRANTRLPIDTEGDTYSLAACNDVGAKRLAEMMDEFGIDSLDVLAEHICARSREAVLAEIAQAAEGHLAQRDDARRLRCAGDARGRADGRRTNGIHVDFTGTSAQSRYGINVPLSYTTAYTVFGLGCVVASQIPNNAGSLGPLTVSAPLGAHPERAEARAGVHPPRHRADAARRGVRLPAADHSGSRAGRGHVVPVESQCARRDPGGRRRQLRVHDGGDLERRHRRAARQGRAVGHRLSERRARHAGRDRRKPDAADLLEEGAAAGLGRRRAARRAGTGRSSRSAAASTGRGTSSRRSTASTIRRAGATVGTTARPATLGSSPARRCAARASRKCRRATGWWC